jgi:hypothetical protein
MLKQVNDCLVRIATYQELRQITDSPFYKEVEKCGSIPATKYQALQKKSRETIEDLQAERNELI